MAKPKKAVGACRAISYTYQQHAVVECSGVISVPDDLCARGDAATHEYIRENEHEASEVTNKVIDWGDEVANTMEHENA